MCALWRRAERSVAVSYSASLGPGRGPEAGVGVRTRRETESVRFAVSGPVQRRSQCDNLTLYMPVACCRFVLSVLLVNYRLHFCHFNSPHITGGLLEILPVI